MGCWLPGPEARMSWKCNVFDEFWGAGGKIEVIKMGGSSWRRYYTAVNVNIGSWRGT